MRNAVCCVSNCYNSNLNSNLTFHRFPGRSYLLEQREKWIKAVQKINGESWKPKRNNYICSKHFVGNAPSHEMYSPSYVPRIFTDNNVKLKKQLGEIKRYNRFKKRVLSSMPSLVKYNAKIPNVDKPDENLKASSNMIVSLKSDEIDQKKNIENTMDTADPSLKDGILKIINKENNKLDKGCQVSVFENDFVTSEKEILICNKFVTKTVCSEEIINTLCEAETQTYITRYQ